jgi:hypothetical protein
MRAALHMRAATTKGGSRLRTTARAGVMLFPQPPHQRYPLVQGPPKLCGFGPAQACAAPVGEDCGITVRAASRAGRRRPARRRPGFTAGAQLSACPPACIWLGGDSPAGPWAQAGLAMLSCIARASRAQPLALNTAACAASAYLPRYSGCIFICASSAAALARQSTGAKTGRCRGWISPGAGCDRGG